MTSPAVLLDGPLGFEATHIFNGFTINDLSALPYVRIDKITGLHDVSEAADPRDNLPSYIGEIAYPTLRRGKTVVYNCTICARSLQELRSVSTRLRAAASSLGDTGLAISPHPSIGGVTLTGFGRPLSAPNDDQQITGPNELPTPWQRPVIISFRLRDPRFFDISNPVTGGAGSGVAAALVVPGNAPVEPTFTVAAPGGAVTLRHVGLGRTLAFRSDLPAGSLLVDFASRQARIGTRDVAGFIDWALTDWWDQGVLGLLPGATQSVSATGGAWTVTAYPAVF